MEQNYQQNSFSENNSLPTTETPIEIAAEEKSIISPIEQNNNPFQNKAVRRSRTRLQRSSADILPSPPVNGRQPPFSMEAEQGVLGCIMLDPKNNLTLFISKLKGKDNIDNIFYF